MAKKHPDPWHSARKHLANDPVMDALMTALGPCTLKPRRDHFVVLCKSIYAQQISTTVANVLFGRFRERFPQKRPTPARVLKLLKTGKDEELKHCGLSRQKKEYLIDLAHHFKTGQIPSRLSRMDDEQVIEALTAVKGIGRWTAEMFLIFVLNRPDVWPVDDLGVQEAYKKAYRLAHRPKPKELKPLGDAFKPWRTVASWYLWKSGDLEESGW